MKVRTYTIHVEPAQEGGYWSSVPLLPGCFSQGETIEETIENTKEAMALYLEGLQEQESDIPEESALSLSVRVPVSV